MEFLNDFINGTNGLWAQELYDRGFDDKHSDFLRRWEKSSNPENIKLVKGGYNENGEYAVGINNGSESEFSSITQKTYYDLDKGNTFYIYIKNNYDEPATFKIILKSSETNEIYYTDSIIAYTGNWKKHTLNIPILVASHSDIIEIGLQGKGDIEIDECSLMRADNVDGIRKEFYDYFIKWKPGIIRYPGGYFADTKLAHFEFGIGNIDKRKSPLLSWEGHYQRMDFGLNEFIEFCKKLNAQAHLVVNLLNGTADETANFVEYCNGAPNTIYGNKRKEDGFINPYNVVYWEIGNEQWYDTNYMIPRYLIYTDKMSKKSKDLKFIIDGDCWQGKNYFDACLRNTIGQCHNYSYHYATFGIPQDSTVKFDDVDRYLNNISIPENYNYLIKLINNWLIEDNYYPFVKSGITEHMIMYRIQDPWIDTNNLNASLEAGLIQANILLNNLENADVLELYEKTFGLNHIRTAFNKVGKRVFYPTVIHQSLDFVKNNSGTNIIPISIVAPKFNNVLIEGMMQIFDVPLLYANYSKDSLKSYLYLLNRSADSVANVFIDDEVLAQFKDYNVFELHSDSYLDYNSADEPNKINYRLVKDTIVNNIINIKPHSLKVIVAKNVNNVEETEDVKFILNNSEIKFLNLNKEIYECEIYNLLGGKIFNTKTNNPIIKLNNLTNGVYILLIKINNKVYRYKIYC